MITSLQNDKVKYTRALQSRRRVRQRERHFVLEGVRLVEEAVRVDVRPAFVFHTQAAGSDERCARLLQALREVDIPCYGVSESVMVACADTETPQGILAVLPIPDLARPNHPTFTLVLDRVRDPGNLGTILRTALAAGVEQVLLTPGTVDATNPKVVRSAMGAHLRLPVTMLRWDAITEAVVGCDVWLAAAGGEMRYTAVDWTRPVALIVGGEASGAGGQAGALARGQVSIPMAEGVESLNTAVAAAVILFEALQQRMAPERGAA
ncbi:MAG: RNA methyltransferase [Chloroflexi bacterium]|nr:MAG: RNA methyltransferase [Chloroflexota bacterium]